MSKFTELEKRMTLEHDEYSEFVLNLISIYNFEKAVCSPEFFEALEKELNYIDDYVKGNTTIEVETEIHERVREVLVWKEE